MEIQQILAQADALFEENKGEEAERLLRESAARAAEEQDDESLLSLLNELLGYYREASRYEEAYRVADRAVEQAEKMGLEGTIPYATTLLNVANVYRAGGRLQESLEKYLLVQEIYRQRLSRNSMLSAGLQNNISLLYQEMGRFEEAKECQLKALQIVKDKRADYELGVTYANLAATCVQLGQMEEAREYAERSIQTFDGIGNRDSHFGAALSALGAWHFYRKEYREAGECYEQAMGIVERGIGKNQAYYRLQENLEACRREEERVQREQAGERESETQERMGLALCRAYYEALGAPMIRDKFGKYENRIAVGLAGRGSDCFGYDDFVSGDHDWGPGFCMWLTEETYREIGAALQQAYEELPEEFQGYRRAPKVNGRNRRGVMRISEFYKSLLGTERYEEIDWRSVSDASLAAAVNGEVFRDDEGVFTAFRNRLEQGYPRDILNLKLAEAAAGFSQAAQYNFQRMYRRGDRLTAGLMVWNGIRDAMRLRIYLDGKYPPHEKWLCRRAGETPAGQETLRLLGRVQDRLASQEYPIAEISELMEKVGQLFATEMYQRDLISDIDPYLDAHSEELIYKASLEGKSGEELVEEIARLEFEAFDKVKNEGGRASCQNDWPTFSVMRKSQYLTWDRAMLLQYLYDFRREYARGHNLIEEKYGRMMKSTAPEKYEEIKAHFPELSEEKQAIIEQICSMQVKWMEEFAEQYPALADNARSIHTYEDNPFDTSYETYLRGELGTYSDKMLELYGRYIVSYGRQGKNPAYDIMSNSARMYGYRDIDEAEEKTGQAIKV
ncbi:MAG: DUF4125 family protein [Roseburia sp.]|nr:DUF4125 family protein [Roseburia sp.]MCM1099069.1 DUF4125 family protein [Ruminococcus flavefaciens]